METTRSPQPLTAEAGGGDPNAPLGAACPADPLLRTLWGQWKTHVIYVLGSHGPCRFGALRRTIAGISPKVLTQRLRELEKDGLVWREHEPTIPPRVTYGLTELGREVHAVLQRFDALAGRLGGRGHEGTRMGTPARGLSRPGSARRG